MKRRTMEDGSIYLPELMTNVFEIEYRFTDRAGVISMPAGNCVHMSGAIRLFERIDPDVEEILSIAGETPDNIYRKTSDGWTARRFFKKAAPGASE